MKRIVHNIKKLRVIARREGWTWWAEHGYWFAHDRKVENRFNMKDVNEVEFLKKLLWREASEG